MSMRGLVLVLAVAVAVFGATSASYVCNSYAQPTTGVQLCDEKVCEPCAEACKGKGGWEAVCDVQGGIVTETCNCLKSPPYHCDEAHPTVGVPACDVVCESCKDSCFGFVGWDAVCKIEGGIVTENCHCRGHRSLPRPGVKLAEVDVVMPLDMSPKQTKA